MIVDSHFGLPRVALKAQNCSVSGYARFLLVTDPWAEGPRRCGARRGSTASSAMRRAVPSAASTWPCGQRADNFHRLSGGQQFVAAQHGTELLDALGGPARQVGEGSVLG